MYIKTTTFALLTLCAGMAAHAQITTFYGPAANRAGPMFGMSITINDGANKGEDEIPQTVKLREVSFKTSDSGIGAGSGKLYLHVYDAFGVNGSATPALIGNLVAVSSSTVDFDAVNTNTKVTWSFNNDELDKDAEYFYILASSTNAATLADSSMLTPSSFKLDTGNPYKGGQAWRANGTTASWDMEFEVVVADAPKPIVFLGSIGGIGLLLVGLCRYG